ncbi:hypothetical protein H1C71_000962 [Ictidomys tridecemlineatus]|nr:hypothetical protein H1C71_000962 [Ictidomys tridecemlineatus]
MKGTHTANITNWLDTNHCLPRPPRAFQMAMPRALWNSGWKSSLVTSEGCCLSAQENISSPPISLWVSTGACSSMTWRLGSPSHEKNPSGQHFLSTNSPQAPF